MSEDHELNGTTLGIDPHANLLRSHREELPLRETSEPELYSHIFPYSEPPRVEFNFRHVPMRTPESLWMTDTTFRDGQQALPPFTVDQIVRLYKYLSDIGGPNGMIRQSEFFVYSKKDREAVEKCQALGLKYPEITGWVRAESWDFQIVKRMGVKETGILTPVSDYHIFYKLKKAKRSEAIDHYLGIVKRALDADILPRCHFEDITKADFYGFVVPFARELMKLGEEAKKPIKIRICDTLGIAVPYPGASLPLSAPGLVYGLNWYARVPSDRLEWHGHNDFAYAKANAVTAWLHGCSAVNGTLFGFGERTGNPALEEAAFEYWRLKGTNNGMNLGLLCEVAEYYEKELGLRIPPNKPHVGKAAFQTAAGIHIGGLSRGKEATGNEGIVYLPMEPGIAGNEARVIITDKSGAAGVAYVINKSLGLQGEEEVGERHPMVVAVAGWVSDQYRSGRTTKISDEEMRRQIELHKDKLSKKSEK